MLTDFSPDGAERKKSMSKTKRTATPRNKTEVQAEGDRYRLWQAQDLLRSLADQGILVEHPDGSFTIAPEYAD